MKNKYIEGWDATKNFEEGMKALFKVSIVEVVKAEKKLKKKPGAPGSRPPFGR